MYDEDKLSEDDLLGFVELDISTFDKDILVQQWHDVQDGKGQVELGITITTRSVIQVQPAALQTPRSQASHHVLCEARELLRTYQTPQPCVDFLDKLPILAQAKVDEMFC